MNNYPGFHIAALAGGVGGAKLAYGLAQICAPQDLTIIVNTGDDFDHLGMHISPDLDTICYTLAGLEEPGNGWGRADDTFHALENIALLGGDSWFRLGDKDLAVHIERTNRLKNGKKLNEVTREFCQAWGVKHGILPMSNDSVQTMIDTYEFGILPFQDYFVRQRCGPRIKKFFFKGADDALPAPGVIESINSAQAIILCPSNPWVSIDPILAIRDIRSCLVGKPVVAISPIVGGRAIKGPAAKMFLEMGIQPSAVAVAEHYQGLISGFVLDETDGELIEKIISLDIQPLITQSIMKSSAERIHLAQDVLDFIYSL